MDLLNHILSGIFSQKEINNWEDAFAYIIFGDGKWNNLLWQNFKGEKNLSYDTIEVYDYPRKNKIYVAAYTAMPFAHHTGKADIYVAQFTYNNLIKRFDKNGLDWTGIFDFVGYDNNLNRLFDGSKPTDSDIIDFIKDRPMWQSHHWRNESLRVKQIA